MSTVVKFSEKLVQETCCHDSVFGDSMEKQIEHRLRIGKIAEENPNLSYNFIKDILIAKQDVKGAEVLPY